MVQTGIIQTLQGAAFYVRMRNADSKKLQIRLTGEIERNFLSLHVKVDAERVVKLRAEKDNILLTLDEY